MLRSKRHESGPKNRRQFSPILFFLGPLLFLSALTFFIVPQTVKNRLYYQIFHPELHASDIAKALGKRRIMAQNLRDTLSFTVDDNRYEIISTIRLDLQEKIEDLYHRYDPLYAAFVAIDPETGAVLAMVDHSRIGSDENLALRSTFPAASVFKIVTSAAAIESANMKPQTAIPFNGAYTTLYKHNLSFKANRWTRFIPLSEALAKSINSIFGKIAIHGIGRENLQQYANAFGFNQAITFDMPVDISSVIVPNDEYGLAESGSGFTKRQTLSPLQGALIAATIASDGKTPRPTIIKSVLDENKHSVYEHAPSIIGHPITPATANLLAQMMEKTITQGTARKQYWDYARNPILSNLFIGAKTGSLTGDDPHGRYDWFVGFARSSLEPTKKIAFASMIINDKYWRVKASYIAREFLLEYFKDAPALVSKK